ncbi:hypothetical protein E2F48_05955 [Arthrobacter crusticola]|uniref:DUF4190 domain-containing protein n=1 Tax=Arthrobacter crusticola TaxID=2547960 RepID=A0A4R5TZQ1_9MICC|nr:hypothetical protein [Arthrobacter crusticola]TDK26723.1 hypothetical protein E2F48_05955 [Arthrobacter crusticola]
MNQRPAPPSHGPSDRPSDRPHSAGSGRPSPGREPAPEEGARALPLWFLSSLVAAVATSSLDLPFKVLGLGFSILALGLGIATLVRAVRRRLGGLARASAAMGVGLAGFLALSTAVLIALWPVTADYEDCIDTALTLEAERACQDRLLTLDGFLSD